MANAEVAACDYAPAGWPGDTYTIIRRVRLETADGRSRRRRTVDPDQLTLALDEKPDHVYAVSFLVTNLPVCTAADIVAVEAWFRGRVNIEERFREAKLGAALRHLPSGDKRVNEDWTWAALLAGAISVMLQSLSGLDDIAGRARSPRLRHQLLATPARIIRHARNITLRLPPDPTYSHRCWPASAPYPPRPDRPPPSQQPRTATAPRSHIRDTGMPTPSSPTDQDRLVESTQDHGATRGSGTDDVVVAMVGGSANPQGFAVEIWLASRSGQLRPAPQHRGMLGPLQLTVEYSDGRRGQLAPPPGAFTPGAAGSRPVGDVVVVPGAGGGDGSYWRQEIWVAPLPPPGVFRVGAAVDGSEVTWAECSRDLVRSAAERAQPFWADGGFGEPVFDAAAAPELPPAGVTPSDSAAAERDIRAAFRAFTAGGSGEELDVVQDGAVLVGAARQASLVWPVAAVTMRWRSAASHTTGRNHHPTHPTDPPPRSTHRDAVVLTQVGGQHGRMSRMSGSTWCRSWVGCRWRSFPAVMWRGCSPRSPAGRCSRDGRCRRVV